MPTPDIRAKCAAAKKTYFMLRKAAEDAADEAKTAIAFLRSLNVATAQAEDAWEKLRAELEASETDRPSE